MTSEERWNVISRDLLAMAAEVDLPAGRRTEWKKWRIAARLRELAAVIQDQWEADDLADDMELELTLAGTD